MLALTRKTDYALIALCHLARQPERVISARQIARRFSMPLPLLMNVLKTLAAHEVVRSVRGAKGGYQLARRPEDLTLDELIEVIEGPIRLTHCTAKDYVPEPEHCSLHEKCPLRSPASRLHNRLKAFLGDVTLAEIAGLDDIDETLEPDTAHEAPDHEPARLSG